MSVGRQLRRVLIARLSAQVPALEGRIYDMAKEGTQMPYATLGPSDWTPADVACVQARRVTVQIDIWDKDSNKGAMEDLTDAVAAALKGFSDTVSMTLPPMQIELVRVLDDPDGLHVHGIVQVTARPEGG